MNSSIQESSDLFKEYIFHKREEIQKMSSLYNVVLDDIRITEAELLLKSYIVLSYAYWESNVEYLKKYFILSYESINLDYLSHTIKSITQYELFKKSLPNAYHNKSLSEIKHLDTIKRAYQEVEEKQNILIRDLDDTTKRAISVKVVGKSSNPRLKDLSAFMKNWDINIKRHIDSNESFVYFEKAIDFLVNQRNSIAHKNDVISYNKKSFSNYKECINDFIETENIQFVKNVPMEFLNELNLLISAFFNSLIDLIDFERNKEREV